MSIKSISKYLESTPQTLLFFFAVIIQLIASGVSGAGWVINNSTLLVVGFFFWVAWFILIIIVISSRSNTILNQGTKALKRGALIIFITLFVLGILEAIAVTTALPKVIQNQHVPADLRQALNGLTESYQYNDATALSQQATENLLASKNPYTNANIVEALIKYHGEYDRVTPLRLGAFSDVFPYPSNEQLQAVWNKAIQNPTQPPVEYESRVCYPAVSFLLPAPFIYLGISDIRIVYAILVIIALAYAVWVIPKQKRLLFVGAALISLELWNSIAGGETGSLTFALLLVAWLALNRNLWLSAVFMGLAVADKQIAWFFLPFYLILLFQTRGMKNLLFVLLIIAGIFAVTNLPFAVNDPKNWFISILSPMTDPMFPIGGGLSALLTAGLLHIKSSLPFDIMEGVVFIATILWYFRYCKRYPQLGLILAIIPLFFAWRSLWSYFFYAGTIALAYILANDVGQPEVSTNNKAIAYNSDGR